MTARTLLGSLAFFALTAAGVAHALPNEITFEIKKGDHVDRQGLGIAHMQLGRKTRVLSFKAFFPTTAAYATQSPANQADANKLLGISTANNHNTSLRLGWAFNPASGKMTLRLYAYVKGARINEPVTEVALGTWNTVQLRLGNDGVSTEVNGIKVSRPANPGFGGLSATWVVKTAYFGGQETAPKNLTVMVKDLSVN